MAYLSSSKIEDSDDPYGKRIHIHSRLSGGEHKYWLIPGWIGQDDLVVAFGPSGSGKSVFAADLACRLAAGWNLDGTSENHPRNVLYIAAERPAQVQRRIDAFCRHHGGERFDNLAIYDGPIDLMKPDELREIVLSGFHAFGRDDVDLVIIDTLASAMSASDSSPEAMARAVHSLTDAARSGNPEGGCAILVVHHSGASDVKRMRGATQLHAAADTVIHISRKGDTSTATVVKNNESGDRPTRRYTMETVSLGASLDGVETTAPVLISAAAAKESNPSSPKVSRSTRTALAVLAGAIEANGGPVTDDQWREAVYAEAGDLGEAAKRQRFTRARKLLEDGVVTETAGFISISA